MRTFLTWQTALSAACLVAMALHFALDRALWPLWAVVAAGSVPLLWEIAAKMLKKDIGADMLGAVGLVASIALGEMLAATLIVLMLAGGQALEAYAMRRASNVLAALAARMPAVAHKKTASGLEDIPASTIQPGDVVVVYPHEVCPVDGAVVEGHGSMDEAYLTGEPYQVSKAPGVAVLSGAINGASALTIRADKHPSDSRYATIMRVMEEAEQRRPQLRRLGDQLGGVFALVSLLFAAAVWAATGDAHRMLSVLVIATPCPLIIAIPIAIVSAISLSARRGIIIQNPTVLERLPTCRTAIFDKTGTLTYGRPELVNAVVAAGVARADVLSAAASLERYSRHPLASAVLDAAAKEHLTLQDATQVQEKPGQGLTGVVNGRTVMITHRGALLKHAPEIASALPPAEPGMECVVLMGGALAATLRFRDTPRADGHSFIDHLGPKHQFTRIMLVSGDRAAEVEHLARVLGIAETYASQSPEEKLALVRAETAKAPTLFMGDGINDAPALTAATVGVAFGAPSAATAEAAGAVIMEHSLAKVDELLHISLLLRQIALQSAIGGMALSAVGMGFAAAGWISPVMGALLQEVIDVVAIVAALRLTWKPKVATDIG